MAETVYEFRIKRGVRFQPHPALAVDGDGRFLYHDMRTEQLRGVHSLSDFDSVGTRELTADDFVYQIKRIANPRRHSPIAGLMAQYIIGFDEFSSSFLNQAF